jgi:type I restriction enzyme S subunit
MQELKEHIANLALSKVAGKLVPQIRFKEFEKELRSCMLDDIVTFKSGGTPSKENDTYWNGDIPWISAASMLGKYYSKSERTITENGLKNGSKLALKGNLLLLVRGSMLYNKIPVGIAERDVAFNQDLKALIPNVETNNEFLYQWLAAQQNFLLDKVTGTGIGAGKLDTDDLKSLKLSLPSLPEQQKIASFLSAVDEKIQHLTKKKELLEHYKKGVMQQLFSGKLRFKDDNGKNYPDWEFVGGNELFENISDKNHNSDLPILAITQDQGAIPRELINYEMSVTEASVASYKVVKVGDFVISLRTFQGGIEYSDYHGICSPAYIILRPSSDEVDRTFYKFYLKTDRYIRQLQKNLEGIRDGKMISYKYFSEIKLPFPSLPEQQKIANFLSTIDTKIESVNQQITQTQTFKKGLLQQMFV